MNSRLGALVLATLIALAVLVLFVVIRDNATAAPIEYSGGRANVTNLTYEQARLHATAMHDELCEVWSQDSSHIIDMIHERYGADPADISFVAGLICPIGR